MITLTQCLHQNKRYTQQSRKHALAITKTLQEQPITLQGESVSIGWKRTNCHRFPVPITQSLLSRRSHWAKWSLNQSHQKKIKRHIWLN